MNPPIYPRATLVHAGGRWRIEQPCIDDLVIELPGGVSVEAGDPRAARVRYRSDGCDDTAWSCAPSRRASKARM